MDKSVNSRTSTCLLIKRRLTLYFQDIDKLLAITDVLWLNPFPKGALVLAGALSSAAASSLYTQSQPAERRGECCAEFPFRGSHQTVGLLHCALFRARHSFQTWLARSSRGFPHFLAPSACRSLWRTCSGTTSKKQFQRRRWIRWLLRWCGAQARRSISGQAARPWPREPRLSSAMLYGARYTSRSPSFSILTRSRVLRRSCLGLLTKIGSR